MRLSVAQCLAWSVVVVALGAGYVLAHRAQPAEHVEEPEVTRDQVRAPVGRVRMARVVEQRGRWRVAEEWSTPVAYSPSTRVAWTERTTDVLATNATPRRIRLAPLGTAKPRVTALLLEEWVRVAATRLSSDLVIPDRGRTLRLRSRRLGRDGKRPNWPAALVGSPDSAHAARNDALARRLLLIRYEPPDASTETWTLADWRESYARDLGALVSRLDGLPESTRPADRVALWDLVALATSISMPEAREELIELGRLLDRRSDLRSAQGLVPLARLMAGDLEARFFVESSFERDPEPLPVPMHRPEERARYLSRLFIAVADDEVREWVAEELLAEPLPVAAAVRLGEAADDGLAVLPTGLAFRIAEILPRRTASLATTGWLTRLRSDAVALLLVLVASCALTLRSQWKRRRGLAAAGASVALGLLATCVELSDIGWQDAAHTFGLLVAGYGVCVIDRTESSLAGRFAMDVLLVGSASFGAAAVGGGAVMRGVGGACALLGLLALLAVASTLAAPLAQERRVAPRRPRRVPRAILVVAMLVFNLAMLDALQVQKRGWRQDVALSTLARLVALGGVVAATLAARASLLRGSRLTLLPSVFVAAFIGPLALVVSARVTANVFGFESDGLSGYVRMAIEAWLLLGQMWVLLRLNDAARLRGALEAVR